MRIPTAAVSSASPSGRRPSANTAIAAGILIWIGIVVAGGWQLTRYSLTPGPTGGTALTMPSEGPLAQLHGAPALVVTLHPECGCSRATLEEVGRIIEGCGGGLQAVAVFEVYPGLPHGVEESDRWKQASAIPGLRCIKDPSGVVAESLGARASGDVCLFLNDRLVFHGGVTSGRGHSGANACSDAVIALVRGANLDGPLNPPVFGCLLKDEE